MATCLAGQGEPTLPGLPSSKPTSCSIAHLPSRVLRPGRLSGWCLLPFAPRLPGGPGPWASPDPALLQQAGWAWKMTGTSSPWSSTMGTPGGSPSRTSASCRPTTRSSVSGLGPPCPLTSRKPGLRRGDASSQLPRLVSGSRHSDPSLSSDSLHLHILLESGLKSECRLNVNLSTHSIRRARVDPCFFMAMGLTYSVKHCIHFFFPIIFKIHAYSQAANAGDSRDAGSIPESGRPWRRKWHSSAIFLPEKFYGQEEPGGL